MADESIYNRLRKLFSSNVVVRYTGNKKLRVVDSDQIQSRTRRARTDRWTRLHRNASYSNSRELAIAYQSNRMELFRDYDVMDQDPILSSALDIYADESTTKNEFGEMLKIDSSNEQIKQILDNLFYDILNVEHTLWMWIRNLCKYGDFFLYLDINEEVGIVNVLPLSSYDVQRIEGWDEDNPYRVLFTTLGGGSLVPGKDKFEEFEIAHFRLMSDSNFLPYGKSVLENARKVWKQITLMEDAMLIHRIMRAPERRVFKIDIGNIAPNEVDAYIQKIMNQMKKIPLIDPHTGEYNLKFNVQNMLEDYFLPVRGGDSGTQIDNLPGLDWVPTDDIEMLQNKLFAAIKIPKAFLGYDETTEGKATLAAEDVRFARTIERVQNTIVSELTKIAIIHLFIQGYKGADIVNFSLSLTYPSTIAEQEKINLWAEKVNLARDIKDLKMLSTDWIYEKIFNLSKEEYEGEREKVADDLKLQFRYQQIEDEGNDPAQSGEKADAAGDGAGVSGNTMTDNENDVDIDYDADEFKQGGRPPKTGNRNQDENAFGRDPLGKKINSKKLAGSSDRSTQRSFKGGSPMSLEHYEKIIDQIDAQFSIRDAKLLNEVNEGEEN